MDESTDDLDNPIEREALDWMTSAQVVRAGPLGEPKHFDGWSEDILQDKDVEVL